MLKWSDSPDVLAGIFGDPCGAQCALAELRAKGFGEHQLDVLRPSGQIPAPKRTVDVAKGAAVGVGLGVAVGAWAVAFITAASPGVGPVIAGGLLTPLMTGAAGG